MLVCVCESARRRPACDPWVLGSYKEVEEGDRRICVLKVLIPELWPEVKLMFVSTVKMNSETVSHLMSLFMPLSYGSHLR